MKYLSYVALVPMALSLAACKKEWSHGTCEIRYLPKLVFVTKDGKHRQIIDYARVAGELEAKRYTFADDGTLTARLFIKYQGLKDATKAKCSVQLAVLNNLNSPAADQGAGVTLKTVSADSTVKWNGPVGDIDQACFQEDGYQALILELLDKTPYCNRISPSAPKPAGDKSPVVDVKPYLYNQDQQQQQLQIKTEPKPAAALPQPAPADKMIELEPAGAPVAQPGHEAP